MYFEDGEVTTNSNNTISASDVSGRSVFTCEIHVWKKPKPSDYDYRENVEYVSWAKLEVEARALISKVESRKKEYEEELKILPKKADNLRYDAASNLLYLTANGNIISDGVSVLSGGTGSNNGVVTKVDDNEILYHVTMGLSSSGSNADLQYTMTLKNLLSERIFNLKKVSVIQLKFSYSSVDDQGQGDGNGIGKLYVDDTEIKTFSVTQGTTTMDVTDYISVDGSTVTEQKITIRVENSEGMYRVLTYLARKEKWVKKRNRGGK